VIGTVFSHTRFGSMRRWTVLGCVASAAMLLVLSVASFIGPAWPLRPSVFCLGLANGVFAVAAIGSMMGLVGAGQKSREGVRMGLWGAAQAVAFALGGLAGTGVVDAVRYLFGSPLLAYAVVFAGEAVLFVVATTLAVRTTRGEPEVNGFPSAADPEGYAPQARG
jgi:BCD family chlorophyll transporter-like MFS transporter